MHSPVAWEDDEVPDEAGHPRIRGEGEVKKEPMQVKELIDGRVVVTVDPQQDA